MSPPLQGLKGVFVISFGANITGDSFFLALQAVARAPVAWWPLMELCALGKVSWLPGRSGVPLWRHSGDGLVLLSVALG